MSSVLIPIHVVSVANLREHFHARAARAKKHRRDSWLAMLASKHPIPTLPVRVTLVRIAPSANTPMDRDNLAGGCKACVDGIADWLGVDDGDDRIEWCYSQEKGGKGQYAVRVTVEEVR